MYAYTVTGLRQLATDTISVTLHPDADSLTFAAGQYVQLAFETKAAAYEFHPFSIVSSPNVPYIRLIIKVLGDYTSSLLGLRIGDKAHIKGPYGMFSYEALPEKRQMWIAAGVAIAPFLSMAETLQSGVDSVHLIHFVKSLDEAFELDRLQELSRRLGRSTFDVQVRIDRYDAEVLSQIFAMHNGAGVLVCGGKELCRHARDVARQLGHDGTLLFDDFVTDPITSNSYSS